MKKLRRQISMLAAGAMMALVGFQGCSDDDDPIVEPEVETAELMVVHGAADAPTVDVAIDSTVAVPGVSLGDFTPDYLEVAAGDRRIRVSPPNDLANALIDVTVPFIKDKHYTAFAITDSSGNPSILRFEDDLSAPASGKAHIRVAHLVPDGPAIKVALVGTGQGPILENVMFADNTAFFQVVDAGPAEVRVQVQSAGGGGGGGGGGGTAGIIPDIATTFADGGLYTIVLVGKASDASLEGFVIEHKHDHD